MPSTAAAAGAARLGAVTVATSAAESIVAVARIRTAIVSLPRGVKGAEVSASPHDK
ncbi:hypothetical protein GCM10012284_38770 [Mangrovihabitans endophyticus]|uniref:Uncharacterized protein n=1 Tax=Mangrovihabitans endophyticus TaxID=1751298 RepID=A0A8J3C2K7_9ACTN|nr:hypothetical protein GCM10012284_38770 [Mangrovihabitans endophyticus]